MRPLTCHRIYVATTLSLLSAPAWAQGQPQISSHMLVQTPLVGQHVFQHPLPTSAVNATNNSGVAVNNLHSGNGAGSHILNFHHLFGTKNDGTHTTNNSNSSQNSGSSQNSSNTQSSSNSQNSSSAQTSTVTHTAGAVTNPTNNSSAQNSQSGNTPASKTVNLDLSSTTATSTIGNAGHLGQTGSVSINVGGTQLNVTSTTQLTPAERLAVYQVINSGQQSVVLDSQGSASGGTVTLSSHLSQELGNLVIPKGVTVIDSTKSGSLNFSGNLTDAGTLYVTSTNPTNHVVIDANNISVQAHGLISDVLPTGSLHGSAASQNASLTLAAQNNLTNAGTIINGGSLNLVAGGATVTNSGLIKSISGDINIGSSAPSHDINVIATGGTFEAANGAINVRDASYTGTGNINLTGGNYLSQNLNLYSGSGTATTSVNQISGLLNINAGQAHTVVAEDTLRLGNLTLSGDPTFYNTAGSITIGGNIAVGEALSIVASQDILSTGNYSITANNGVAGFQINLIAGANITAIGASSPIVGPYTTSGTGTPATSTITIDGPSATGGNVSFSGNNMSISSAAVSGNNAGGDVNVIAFANAAGTSGGQVLLSSGTTINSGGSGTGANGNISIIAGAVTGTAVTTGGLNATGGSGAGGNITIQTSQPAPSPNPVTINPNGSLSALNNFVASITNAASVVVNAPVTSSGNISIASANTVTINSSVNVTKAASTITIQSPADLTLAGSGNISTTGGTVSLLAMSAGSSLTIANGTALIIGGGNEVDIRTPNLIFAATTASPSITATGSSSFFIDAGNSAHDVDLSITGPSGFSSTITSNGGTIDISPTGLGNLNFLSSGLAATTLNFNTSGSAILDMHGLGNITIPLGVTVASVSPIQINMNSTAGNQTFTLNGTLKTTASDSPFPDPLGGSMFYSLLTQNLFANFNLAGSGTFLQAGAQPGNTVFNDFVDVGFANNSNIHITSINPGSYANFYTRQIQLNGPGIVSNANLVLNNISAVNFNTNLPSFAPGNVAFVTGGTAATGSLNISGALVNIGFPGTTPPVSIPEAQQPVGSFSVAPGFSLISQSSVTADATNNANVFGTVSSTAGNVDIFAPTIVVGGTGSVLANHNDGNIQLASWTPGGAVDVVNNGLIQALGNSTVIVFNGGSTGAIQLSGRGTVASDVVNFGNLNSISLQMIGPYITIPSFTGSFTLGNISIQQGSITGVVNVSTDRSAPEISIVPSRPGRLNPLPTSEQAVTLNNEILVQRAQFNLAFALFELIAFEEKNQNKLNEQLGTRIATDYTPVRLPVDANFPLQGLITVDQIGLAAALFSSTEFTANELANLSQQGVVSGASSKGNVLELLRGNALFAPQDDIVVHSRYASAYIPKGAAAWIMDTGKETAIYDFHDSMTTGGIKVVANGKQFRLSPGKQMVLVKDGSNDFDSLNPGKTIGYRNVQSSELGDGTKAFVCDFSIARGLMNVPIMRNLLRSENSNQRKIAWKMIKNATILADLTGDIYKINP
jgi:hypothetical protein